jgi:hypothetical protein
MSSKLIAGNATNGSSLSADTSGILEIQTGSTPTTAIIVDTAQNVGIGTASPSYRFDCQNNQNATVNFRFANTNTVDSNSRAYVQCIAGNVTTRLGSINADNSYLQFLPAGGSQRLYVMDGNSIGVYLQTGNTSWTANSDERLKTDLKPIENAIDKVNQLRSVTGRYKTDEEGKSRSFLIAQDVEKVLPEAVTKGALSQTDKAYIEGEEFLGVSYTDVIPLLVAAIKELNAKVDALKGVA